MRKLIFMMLLAFASSNAMAEWLDIGGNKQLGISIFVDPASIRKNGHMVKMWSLYDYKTARENPVGKPYFSQKAQDEHDCKEEKTRNLAFSLFSENMGEGEVVYLNSDPGKWESLVPGSAGLSMWKIACGIR